MRGVDHGNRSDDGGRDGARRQSRRWRHVAVPVAAVVAVLAAAATAAAATVTTNPAPASGIRAPSAAAATTTAPRTARPVKLRSATVGSDGRTLTVTFTGTVAQGPCAANYTIALRDTGAQVVVTVEETPPSGNQHRMCPMIALIHTLSVTAVQPIGGRPLIDGATGQPAPTAAPEALLGLGNGHRAL